MQHQSVKELIDEGKVDPNTLYVTYEENSDIPLYMNGDSHGNYWYENMHHNKIIVKDNFTKLYILPNVKIESEEPEPTINFTLEKLNRVGLWEQLCQLKGWDYYMTAERINDWNEIVEIPLSKAKTWGLI